MQDFDHAAAAQEEKFKAQLPLEVQARRFNSFGQLGEEERAIHGRYSAADTTAKMFTEKEKEWATTDHVGSFAAGEHERYVRNSAGLIGASQVGRPCPRLIAKT